MEWVLQVMSQNLRGKKKQSPDLPEGASGSPHHLPPTTPFPPFIEVSGRSYSHLKLWLERQDNPENKRRKGEQEHRASTNMAHGRRKKGEEKEGRDCPGREECMQKTRE